MNRKQYFKDVRVAMIAMTGLGILALFTSEGASLAWKIIIPTFFFTIVGCMTLYGFIKYKK